MSAVEFTRRYGASCRTKHVIALPVRRRSWVAFGWAIARSRLPLVDRRLHAFPARSELPREFIRLDPWEANYLFLMASHAAKGIVEIGRLHGGSTFLLACANARVPIWSIDRSPDRDVALQKLFRTHGIGENVELLVGDSQRDAFREIGEFDVLFVDGDHSYAGCSADLNAFLPRLASSGHVLLHDCYAGRDVQPAVLDYLATHELDVVRSPYIPTAHWHTSYGSIAHLRKPQGTAQNTASQLPRLRRAPAAAAAIAAVLALVFVVLPEALGDRPYDPQPIAKAEKLLHVKPKPRHEPQSVSALT
jgi:predicted O-methyltransferase YrrM